MESNINIIDEFIKTAYNKALYTYRSGMLYDNLEVKYVNLNYHKVKSILKKYFTNIKCSNVCTGVI